MVVRFKRDGLTLERRRERERNKGGSDCAYVEMLADELRDLVRLDAEDLLEALVARVLDSSVVLEAALLDLEQPASQLDQLLGDLVLVLSVDNLRSPP